MIFATEHRLNCWGDESGIGRRHSYFALRVELIEEADHDLIHVIKVCLRVFKFVKLEAQLGCMLQELGMLSLNVRRCLVLLSGSICCPEEAITAL